MKKLVLFGVMLSLSGLSGQAVLADIKAPAPDADINTKQQNTPSWLGVWIDNLPMSLGIHLSSILKEYQGVMVSKVSPNSPAAKAGLQQYDVIAEFNDQEIFSQQQFTRLIRNSQPQTTVKLAVIRLGKLKTLDVVLEASPEQKKISDKPHGRYAPFFPHHGRGMGQLPPPWLNSPFYDPDFNQVLKQPGQQRQSWSQFESFQIQSIGKDKHRAEVRYEDSEGNKKEFIFEGNGEEIRQQILKQEGMSEDKKQSLLQALDMNTAFPPPPFGHGQHRFMQPDWFNQPIPMPYWFQPHR